MERFRRQELAVRPEAGFGIANEYSIAGPMAMHCFSARTVRCNGTISRFCPDMSVLRGNRLGGGDVVVNAKQYRILPQRERASIRNQWLKRRMETVLPEVMRREGFDMWIVSAREYNEDPVIMSLLPAEMLSARRRTILVFSLTGTDEVECLTLSRYGIGDLYRGAWDPEREDQWECLAGVVRDRDPGAIAINMSEMFPFGDGLTHSEYLRMMDAVDDKYAKRMGSAERLAVGWLEKRMPEELDAYERIVEIAHAMICEAFSSRVIHPGITTCEDVIWWFRQRITDLGLSAWFHPSVSIQAHGQTFRQPDSRALIQPGDVLHCDVGLRYLGLNTDTQQLAYVLRRGESDAPRGLREALAAGNQLQDITAAEFVAGRTGNEILAKAQERAREAGLDGKIYTHPIGVHGHGAGPTIGLWDKQDGVSGRGDYPLYADTCYALELSASHPVPEWNGQPVLAALEQDVAFTGDDVHYLAGRQTEYHLI